MVAKRITAKSISTKTSQQDTGFHGEPCYQEHVSRHDYSARIPWPWRENESDASQRSQHRQCTDQRK
jgi:hypothetical protein